MTSSVTNGENTGQSPEVDLEPGRAMHPETHLAIEQPSPQAKSVDPPPWARRFRKHLRTVTVHVRRCYPRFKVMPLDCRHSRLGRLVRPARLPPPQLAQDHHLGSRAPACRRILVAAL